MATYILLESCSSLVKASANEFNQIPDFNFVAAGNWGCDCKPQSTVNKIRNRLDMLRVAKCRN
ncbi:MAG TPA: hypothetical protein VFX26_06135 [Nitrososphaeraceae archaeon]|nr:hypothetical protein [Nitrososphaeraceae archaeon]